MGEVGLSRESRVGDFRPDLIVEAKIVVEVISVLHYEPVFTAQVLTTCVAQTCGQGCY